MPVCGIGVDVCGIARVARLAARFGDRFLDRAFHPAEVDAYRALAAGAVGRGRGDGAAAQFLASRWAAKEALHKALATNRLLFPEVEVVRGGAGRAPAFAFHGAAAGVVAARGVRALLSLSHDGDTAVAMVVLDSSA